MNSPVSEIVKIAMILFSCLVVLLPGAATSWAVSGAWQQQPPLANSLQRPTAAQHHCWPMHGSTTAGMRMAAAGPVAAQSLRTRAPAPQMRLRTDLLAAAAAAMNPLAVVAFPALDALAVLLKLAWKVAFWAAFWQVALKPVFGDLVSSVLRRLAITKVVRALRPSHLAVIFGLCLYPYATRALRAVVSRLLLLLPGENPSRTQCPGRPSCFPCPTSHVLRATSRLTQCPYLP